MNPNQKFLCASIPLTHIAGGCRKLLDLISRRLVPWIKRVEPRKKFNQFIHFYLQMKLKIISANVMSRVGWCAEKVQHTHAFNMIIGGGNGEAAMPGENTGHPGKKSQLTREWRSPKGNIIVGVHPPAAPPLCAKDRQQTKLNSPPPPSITHIQLYPYHQEICAIGLVQLRFCQNKHLVLVIDSFCWWMAVYLPDPPLRPP